MPVGILLYLARLRPSGPGAVAALKRIALTSCSVIEAHNSRLMSLGHSQAGVDSSLLVITVRQKGSMTPEGGGGWIALPSNIELMHRPLFFFHDFGVAAYSARLACLRVRGAGRGRLQPAVLRPVSGGRISRKYSDIIWNNLSVSHVQALAHMRFSFADLNSAELKIRSSLRYISTTSA